MSKLEKKSQKPNLDSPMRIALAKIVVGWREWVALPDLQIKAIKTKVDTGAKTSSLHADELEYFVLRGRRMVRFIIHPVQKKTRPSIHAEAEVFDERWVKSSNGKSELRPVIITEIEFYGQKWPIQLTLTNRDMMGFRMLLGREALKKRFVIDAGRSYLGLKAMKKIKGSEA